ncbi:5' nucleotidase [Streptomyces phage Sham]|nr:5' nucleotidase [Streptomyces phage Sham]
MRVGIDLDGVCYDFAESLRMYLKYSGNTHYNIVEGEPDKWHFYLDWGMTTEEFIKHCNDGADCAIIFHLGDQRDSASVCIDWLRRLGHSIHIITDRSFGTSPSVSESNTKRWLYQHGFEYDTLTFSADKTCVPTDVFIEDKLENYDALVAAGVDCYLVDRPWNQDPGDSRKRVKSIIEFAKIVAEMPV